MSQVLGFTNYKGYYASLAALQAAIPTGSQGWWAIAQDTNTVYIWNVDLGAWASTEDPSSGSITNAMLANMAQSTIKGRAAGEGTGSPQDLTPAEIRALAAVPGTGTANTFTKAQSVTPVAVTSSSASIATDASLSNIFTHTMTENTTLANPTNLVAGTYYTWVFTQHASAAKTLALGNLFVSMGLPFVITTTTSAKAVLTALYDGTSLLYTAAQA